MIFTTTEDLQKYLISQPETGMGYQVFSPSQKGLGVEDLIIVLNAQIAIEFKDLKNNQTENKSLSYNDIKDYSIINLTQLNSFFESLQNEQRLSALDNPIKDSTGSEIERFIRLSAFENDLRIDNFNKCFLPGTYSTSLEDYLSMKANNLDKNKILGDPIIRYSLPVDLPIKWIFYVHPKKGDKYRKGKVQPAFGKTGGGIECFFDFGTSHNTLTSINPY
jgi:hypothetical protein